MASSYQYPALNPGEIRIAELLPSTNPQSPIHCLIKPVLFTTSPPYSALSYTWGDTTKRKPITVENADSEGIPLRQISITSNLDSALRRIRPETGTLTIWIDFLCIDQGNLVERSQQAGIMREVYQRATAVYVWLGEADESSARAWRLMEDIVGGDGGFRETLMIVEDPERRDDINALHTLFRRPYWTRIWVIQEVNSGGKAVTVYCGPQKILWTDLDLVCDRLREVNKVLTAINSNDATLSNALMNGGPKKLTLSTYSAPENQNNPSLFELLLTHQAKDSSDEKDKVYALVGISSSAASFGPLDYTASTPSTFIRAAKHIITTTNKLDVICLRQNDDSIYDLPSWTPDWHCRVSYPNHRKMGLHIRQPRFTASGSSSPIYSFSETENENTLTVRGYVVDVIGDLGVPFRIRGDERKSIKTARTIETFKEWWGVFTSARGGTADSELKLDQLEFSTTVYGGEWSSFTEPLPHIRRFEAFCKIAQTSPFPNANPDLPPNTTSTTSPDLPPWKPFTHPPKTSSSTPLAPATERDYLAMVSSASLRMHWKRFAVTSQRKMACLAPLETAKGDLIVVLFGCSFPVVLRRKERGSGRCVLIGEVYVFGAMKGEMMEERRGREEDFVIE
ncbi:HET-domain-containing protein [Cadophora sp. DSE1049]|nr:HET-domain-containing protein [Cadophora sp. DSE1049]